MCVLGSRNEKLKSVRVHSANHTDAGSKRRTRYTPETTGDWILTIGNSAERNGGATQMNSLLYTTQSASILNGLAAMLMNLYRVRQAESCQVEIRFFGCFPLHGDVCDYVPLCAVCLGGG